ncbi:hypothetical protein VroAM7_49210 (plasmid) [Vibrio rotiferianus]|uniref:Uncharacterized protein n=1 Tax=Vibrio rotiferianus TaxID=190895 RepID=A0A510IGJ6_9VIBR|nr:hypothetical protein [Vibrio rotiferianus]BBL92268.1 hypothetical protein VroAM7_49210 [Vibrio rotiferianus]
MIDFLITENGLLINLHCVLWSDYKEKFENFHNQDSTPEFYVAIENERIPLEEYVTKMIGETHTRCKVMMGDNFINNYMSEDLDFWQEEEARLGNQKPLVDLILKGGCEPLDSNYHVDSHKYYCNAIYPILINFESVSERSRAVTENRYVNWIVRKLLGNIRIEYRNAPSNVDSYVVGMASNDLTVDQIEGLGPFAATLKNLIHKKTNQVHRPLHYLVARKGDEFVMPYVSLMTFQKVMLSENIDVVMNSFLKYLRSFFYLSDMINVIGYRLHVVKGSMAELQNGYTEGEISSKIGTTQNLPDLSYEYLIRPNRQVDPNDLSIPTSNVLISDPNVGRFGIIRTCYDDNKVPIWKTLHYPTTRNGYIELTALTRKIDSLIGEGNTKFTLRHLDLLDAPPEALTALITNAD